MAAIKKSQFKINNGTDWDTYHFETDSAQTKHKKSDGTETTVEEVLNSALGGFGIQTGKTRIIPIPNEQTSVHVTFPKAFKEAPEVFLTARSSVSGKALLGYGTMDTSKTGFDIYVLRINDTYTDMSWVAIGPL